jgi:cytochrome o ubiquinol oxidase subunit 2
MLHGPLTGRSLQAAHHAHLRTSQSPHARPVRWRDRDGRSDGAPVALLPLVLTACHWAVLDPRGPVGQADRTILIDSLAIMLAIGCADDPRDLRIRLVVPRLEHPRALPARLGVLRCHRARGLGDSGHGDHPPRRRGLDRIARARPGQALVGARGSGRIQVISLDWKWLFIYPNEGVASVNQLVVPAGVPLRFSLTSASVWNVFFVPQLGSMIYTMNGMRTQLNLQADETGTFQGLSAHFSGDGFSDMHFRVRAVRGDEFAAWVKATRGVGPTLDGAAYTALARQSANLPPSTFGAVTPELFAQVVRQDLPPGPGPATERGGAAEAPKKGALTCGAS